MHRLSSRLAQILHIGLAVLAQLPLARSELPHLEQSKPHCHIRADTLKQPGRLHLPGQTVNRRTRKACRRHYLRNLETAPVACEGAEDQEGSLQNRTRAEFWLRSHGDRTTSRDPRYPSLNRLPRALNFPACPSPLPPQLPYPLASEMLEAYGQNPRRLACPC